ncbi:hypothetical protein CLV92_103146 [Kineococcus xinjiangensis]|uniref:Uncharacterized protein n=1 Tax=Kineococcus xinjiangensis TaxID=512762 RepID=A0A2S6ITN6_9ACTN|nr:hypothetical protein [Kineococcus xinjiangensis]PPK97612.1 hypothetical protein CLV92_103146 [Kineococcus xinjiangensis]
MSSDPLDDGPVPREAPPPPGASLPDVVDELEERVSAQVQEQVHGSADQAEAAREPEEGEGPSQDVVPDTGDGAADPTLGGHEQETTDGLPHAEPGD